MADIFETVGVWEKYLAAADWKTLVKNVEPKRGGCGLVYELPSPLPRPDESFAIADMRALELAEPHYHKDGETEIYFVLQGVGRIAVGKQLFDLTEGKTIVTPPDTPHITLPGKDLVLAVVNTPPFNANNYMALYQTDPSVADMIQQLRAA